MFSGHACVGTLFECARTQYCCTFVCMNMYTYNEIGIHLCSSNIFVVYCLGRQRLSHACSPETTTVMIFAARCMYVDEWCLC